MPPMNDITNLSIIKNLTGNDRVKIIKYINMYLQYAPELLNSIKSNAQNQQWGEVKKAAHSLAPQLYYMGMEAVKLKVQRIEKNAADKSDLENIAEEIEAVETACNISFEELKAYLVTHEMKHGR